MRQLTDGVVCASRSMDGWLGGIQGGFNYQFPASGLEIGIEADYQWADISGNAGFATLDRFGTVRGRLGFAWDRFLVYGTGGWAFEANTEVNFGPGLVASRSLDGFSKFQYRPRQDRQPNRCPSRGLQTARDLHAARSRCVRQFARRRHPA